MSAQKIRKVGNSLGIIFPKEIQEILNISEGDIIDLVPVAGNKVILDSRLPHHSQWVFKNPKLTDEDRKWVDADLEGEDDKIPRW